LDGRVHDGRHAVNVEEGQNAHVDFLGFLGVQPVGSRHGVRHQVVVGQHGTLRDARRAARVLEAGQVFPRVYLDRLGLGRVPLYQLLEEVDAGPLLHLGRRYLAQEAAQDGLGLRQVVLEACDYDELQARLVPDLRYLFVQYVKRYYSHGLGVVQLVLELTLRVERVYGRHDAPDPQDGVVAYDELRAVGQVDGYLIALLDSQVLEGRGQPTHGLVELLVGHLEALEDYGGGVRVLLGRTPQQLVQGDLWIFYAMWHPFWVELKPGPLRHIDLPSRVYRLNGLIRLTRSPAARRRSSRGRGLSPRPSSPRRLRSHGPHRLCPPRRPGNPSRRGPGPSAPWP